MAVIESLKRFATGKSAIERKQEQAANQIIRQKANAAALRERQIQAVKFAEAKERHAYKIRTENLNKPKRGFFEGASSGNRNFGTVFGVQSQPTRTIAKKINAQPTKRKKRKKKRRTTNQISVKQSQPQHFRVI